MENLSVELENCYGINKLSYNFNFENDNNAYLIYAPNGTMKTSLAKTFETLEPKDLVYNTTSKCDIKIDNIPIQKKDILVIKSQSDNTFVTDKMNLLLINSKSQKKFQEIKQQLEQNETSFLKELSKLSGCPPKNCKEYLKEVICKKINPHISEFYSTIGEHKTRVEHEKEKYLELKGLKYFNIFTAETEALMNDPDFKSFIDEYITRYNTIISSSDFFSREQGFVPHNAEAVEMAIKKNKFLLVENNEMIFAGRSLPITSEEELGKAIEEELKNIREDKELADTLSKVHNKFSNEKLKAFRDYISDNPVIITKLQDKENFKKDLFTCYFIELQDMYFRIINEYYTKEKEIKDLQNKSYEQETSWYKAKNIFQERFTLPIEIEIEDIKDVIYGGQDFKGFKLYFKENNESERIEKDRKELTENILSRGETRALYLLNILFEIEARKDNTENTLIVIDDIADSFDYQNKYAIIEYLYELHKNPAFKLLILTHNFDFYRTVKSRLEITDGYSLNAIKNQHCITLEKGISAGNIFNNWLLGLRQGNISNEKFIALIPFFRNLCEYSIFENSKAYFKFFTSLLHIKNNTGEITKGTIEHNMKAICNITCAPLTNSDKSFLELLYETADSISSSESVSLDKKITLAIAIRLKIEDFMKEKIKQIEPDFDINSIEEYQTRKLTVKLKELVKLDNGTENIINAVNIITPENIHLNSFMYEPILDMSIRKLKNLYNQVKKLSTSTETLVGKNI